MKLKQLHDRAFDNYHVEILEQNYTTLRAITSGTMLISVVLIFTSLSVSTMRLSFFIYITWGVMSLLCFLLCRQHKEVATKHATKLLYILAVVFLITASISGTLLFKTGNSSVVIGMLAILPFVLFDQMWRYYLVQILLSVLFCVLSLSVKSFEVALIDCLNALGFSLLACIVGTYTTRMKLSALRARAVIIRQRDTDPLTTISTRGAAETIIGHWLETGTGKAAFFLLDIDHFKMVNDSLGHLKGDEILTKSAQVMRELFRRSDCVARFGGDEFLVFMTDVSDLAWISEKAKVLNRLLCQTVTEGERSVNISASIGITLCHPGESFDDIYSHADKALYYVKEHGRNGYRFYESSME